MTAQDRTTSTWDLPMLPAKRFGEVLAAARLALGRSIDELAEQSSGAFASTDLANAEAGIVEPDPDTIRALAELYDLSRTGSLATRSRLTIDLAAGQLNAGEFSAEIPSGAAGREPILARYLAAVYQMRSLRPGRRIPLRQDDVRVLAAALDIDEVTVRRQLHFLMMDEDAQVETKLAVLEGSTLIPAAGLLIGSPSVGALVLAETPLTAEDILNDAPPEAQRSPELSSDTIKRMQDAVTANPAGDGLRPEVAILSGR